MTYGEYQRELARLQEARSRAIVNRDQWQSLVDAYDSEIKIIMENLEIRKKGGVLCTKS